MSACVTCFITNPELALADLHVILLVIIEFPTFKYTETRKNGRFYQVFIAGHQR